MAYGDGMPSLSISPMSGVVRPRIPPTRTSRGCAEINALPERPHPDGARGSLAGGDADDVDRLSIRAAVVGG
jgi:hypothetical protein